MQKYLIDTQILIWYQLESSKLSPKIYQLLTDIKNTILVSQTSLFEIAIKQKIGKLPELNIPIEILATAHFENIPIISSDEKFSLYQDIIQFIDND
jgi:PIN domain nuclease of toxin-antitoxin system